MMIAATPDLIRMGSIDFLKAFIAERGVDAPLEFGRSALHICAAADLRASVELLLDAGARVDLCTHLRQTALHCARSAEVAELLLARGADVNAQNKFGETALYAAVRSNLKPVVRALLRAGADPSIPSMRGGRWTPLPLACAKTDADTVAALLRAGAAVNAVTHAGVSAVLVAARMEDTAVVRVLVKAGADVNRMGADGMTAVMEAHRRGRYDMAAALAAGGIVADAAAARLSAVVDWWL